MSSYLQTIPHALPFFTRPSQHVHENQRLWQLPHELQV